MCYCEIDVLFIYFRGFTETVNDPSQHPQYWSLIATYFDGIQEILEISQLGDVAKYLIGEQ
jgi:hypothetical protein